MTALTVFLFSSLGEYWLKVWLRSFDELSQVALHVRTIGFLSVVDTYLIFVTGATGIPV